MSDELREKMRRLIVLHITSSGHTVDELTDAAIALIRADTLEEAAKVADGNGAGLAANRIRALKERT